MWRVRARPVQPWLTIAAIATAALVIAACGSASPSPHASSGGSGTIATDGTTSSTTTTVPPSNPPVSTSGPLTVSAPIPVPFSASAVTAAEGPDGAVFVSPQNPTSTAQTVVWVVDGNQPAAVAETMPSGVAALAADSTNLYIANYSSVIAFDRNSGNKVASWTMPPVHLTNSSNQDLVSLASAAGALDVLVTQGDLVSVSRINPQSAGPPHLLVRGLGATVGPDGSVYYETTTHRLAVLRPDGARALGPVLKHTPNSSGGGVQYVETVAGSAVWTSEPAGQGLDARFDTYDARTLAAIGSYDGVVNDSVVDSAGGPLVLQPAAGSPTVCPQTSRASPSWCVSRIDVHGSVSDPAPVGAAIVLLGPQPAVVSSATASNQFELYRLS
jgi:hypothetical protein